jgi:DNA adenine methylase
VRKRDFIKEYARRIENAHIENDDALKILRSRNVSGAFHYIDPPYFNADQGHYKGYSEEEFVLLLDFLQNECKGKFLLSNYWSDVLGAYIDRNKWNFKSITVRLQAPRKSGKAKQEILVWNYNLQMDIWDHQRRF